MNRYTLPRWVSPLLSLFTTLPFTILPLCHPAPLATPTQYPYRIGSHKFNVKQNNDPASAIYCCRCLALEPEQEIDMFISHFVLIIPNSTPIKGNNALENEGTVQIASVLLFFLSEKKCLGKLNWKLKMNVFKTKMTKLISFHLKSTAFSYLLLNIFEEDFYCLQMSTYEYNQYEWLNACQKKLKETRLVIIQQQQHQ